MTTARRLWDKLGWKEVAMGCGGILLAVLGFIGQDLYQGRMNNQGNLYMVREKLSGIEATQTMLQSQLNLVHIEIATIRQVLMEHSQVPR